LRFRIRSIFVGVNLAVLLVLVGAVGFLQLYESELVRRTESELIAQGAFVRSLYRDRIRQVHEEGCEHSSRIEEYGTAVQVDWPVGIQGRFRPIPPQLDLASDEVYLPAPNPRPAAAEPDPCAVRAARPLEPLLREVQNITLAGIHILDARGTIVASTRDVDGLTMLDRREIQRAMTGDIVSLVRHRDGALGSWSLESIKRRTQMRVFVAIPIVQEGRLLGAVALVRTPISLVKAVYRNRWVFGAFAGAVLLVAVIISLVTGFFVGRPIRRLIDQTRRVARDGADASEPIERPGTREVDELSRAFADMAETLEERNNYIRTFARNVSHEFKTPISSIQGTVELLDEHLDTMSEERRERFLEMLADDAEHMEQLVERLLTLARAEVFQPGDDSAAVAPILQQIAERVDDLRVDWQVDEAVTTLPMAAETLESILTNLLDNADSHGAEGVDIEVRRRGEGDGIEVLVRDDGPGISEGNADKIFEPFFSADRSEGDTGLGLAIAQALMQAHDGDIALVEGSGSERGATFRLAFPRP
jgi:signal transduction histidine kinase